MQDNHDKPSNGAASSEAGKTNLARRKAILKGLGKTAAVAGAAAPLHSLAGAHLRYVDNAGVNHQCSVSGHMSVMHSAVANSVPVCKGLTPQSYVYVGPGGSSWDAAYIKADRWPNWPKNGDAMPKAQIIGANGAAYPTALFSAVFNGGPGTVIGTIINTGSPAAERQWLTALLNAQKFPSQFPHTPADVIAQYNGDATRKAKALELYANWVNKFTSVA